MTILVTGGNGFIGTNFIIEKIKQDINLGVKETIINVDSLTYSSSNHLQKILKDSDQEDRVLSFVKNINDSESVDYLLKKYQPRAIVHFAAESHVDNSISGPEVFMTTNVLGTFRLLESVRKNLKDCKFIHVSTDEVYGSLELDDEPSTEMSLYKPNSPYSASKAGSDHIVRAYHKTYGLNTIITNCSNNYGLHQHEEKFIPTVIKSCVEKKPIPVYGNGLQIRDWLHVTDHCRALLLVLEKGVAGERYNIGGDNQYKNIEVVKSICSIFNLFLESDFDYNKLISFVTDRPGHDTRYDINSSKIKNELGWKQQIYFDDGLYETVLWYKNYFTEIMAKK